MNRELHLFAGAGGGILGGMLLGHQPVCAVEIEGYCRNLLLQRQRDGILPWFPVWDDVRTFDGLPWRGLVDGLCGGFPCQDISVAGKGAGLDGERSGLWSEFKRIIGEVRPQYVFVENSPALASRGLDRVLGDLFALGFDAEWGVVSAADAIWLGGTPAMVHQRDRIWIYAEPSDNDCQWKQQSQRSFSHQRRRLDNGAQKMPANAHTEAIRSQSRRLFKRKIPPYTEPRIGGQSSPDTDRHRRDEMERENETATHRSGVEPPTLQCRNRNWRSDWWVTEPDVGRVAHGVASRMDRIKAIGNGQVPAVAALAFRLLRNRLMQIRK